MIRIMILTILILIFQNLSAPPLSENLKQMHQSFAISEIQRWRYDKEFERFATLLQIKESSDNWQVINPIGCMGSFQIAPGTLKWLGYGHITPSLFRVNPYIFPPELQMKVLKALVRSNEIELNSYFCYVGQVINGVMITRSGLLAGAHIGGASGVKLYLTSHGIINNKDVNGTSVQDYIREYAGFDI